MFFFYKRFFKIFNRHEQITNVYKHVFPTLTNVYKRLYQCFQVVTLWWVVCINKQCVFTSLSKDVQAETRPRSPTNTLSPRRRCCGVGLSTSSLSLPLSFLNLTVFDLVKFRSIIRPRAVSSRSCTCSCSRRRRPISRHLRPAPFGLSSSPSGCGAVATRDYGNLRVTRHFSGVVTHSALHSERIRIPWGGHFPDVGGIFQR